MSDDALNLELVQATARQVVETAGQIEVNLDYTPAVLPQLEQYLLAVTNVYGGIAKLEADSKLMPLVVSIAMYLGETVRRNIGGTWIFRPQLRMTPPFIAFDQVNGSANTANLNVIAAVYDFIRAPNEHAIVYSYATYEKIYRGLPPYNRQPSNAEGTNGSS